MADQSDDSQMSPKDVLKLLSDIHDKLGEGEFIYRGVSKAYSGQDSINSAIYRKHKKHGVFADHFLPVDVEEDIVERARRLFPQNTGNVEILTDLRHFGGDTTLIDFSRNMMVALYFACNRKFKKDGELIACEKNKFYSATEISYDEHRDSTQLVEPAQTENSKARVIAQSSVFVHAPRGYINKADCKTILVEARMKKAVLEYLRNMHNIHDDRIFNDLPGFLANKENFKTAELHFYKGLGKERRGDYEGAIEEYDKVIFLTGGIAEAYNNRGLAKEKSDRFHEAIEDYSKAILLVDNSADAYFNRGNAKFKIEDYKEAIRDYSEAIRLDPYLPDAYMGRGNASREDGDQDGAIKDYDMAIELDPGFAKAYLGRAMFRIDEGDYDGAIQECDTAIQLHPQFFEAYLVRAEAKFHKENHSEAMLDINEAFRLKPDCAKPHFIRAKVKWYSGDYAGALIDLNTAIDLKPEWAELYCLRARIKLLTDDIHGAIEDCTQAIVLESTHAPAHMIRSVAKLRIGDGEGTKEDYERALELDPSLAEGADQAPEGQ